MRVAASWKITARSISGVPANTKYTAAELQKFADGWCAPYSAGPLTKEEHKQFDELGWVIKPHVVSPELIAGAVKAVDTLVDDMANRLHAAGKIRDLCKSAGFQKRLILLEQQFPHASVLLHKFGVLPQGIQNLWGSQRMLDIAAQILGQDQDVVGHPVWNLRAKTPDCQNEGQATVPWHQDNAYLFESCWHHLMVTAWVPLVDATARNGCMQVISGGHRKGVTAHHTCCFGNTWYTELSMEEIEATLGVGVDQVTTVEVPVGSVLFLNNVIPHRSIPNNTDSIRWSLDLRWQRAGEANGFDGLKESLLMRPHGNPAGFVPQWGEWSKIDRQKATSDNFHKDAAKVDEFDTTISGPWMLRWPMTHQNRHTAALHRGSEKWTHA